MIAQGEEVANRIERSRQRKQHTVERRLSQIRNYRFERNQIVARTMFLLSLSSILELSNL